MVNVIDYIKNYCDVHGITRWSLKNCVLSKKDFALRQTFAPGVAFFYHLSAVGEIVDLHDIHKDFLTVSTPTDFYDFKHIAEFSDCGQLQYAKSDFIFSVAEMMNIHVFEGTTNAAFKNLIDVQFHYLYLTDLSKISVNRSDYVSSDGKSENANETGANAANGNGDTVNINFNY